MAPSKVVVITGGASGIGKAAALLFAKNEYKVVIADILPMFLLWLFFD